MVLWRSGEWGWWRADFKWENVGETGAKAPTSDYIGRGDRQVAICGVVYAVCVVGTFEGIIRSADST